MGADQPFDLPVSYDVFIKLLYAACRFYKGVEPEGIAAEVYFKVKDAIEKEPDRYSDPKYLNNFIKYVATNMARYEIRKLKRRAKSFDPADLSNVAANDRDEAIDFPSTEKLLGALIDAPQRVREVFRLHAEGLKGTEIAAKLGVKPCTVSRILGEARELLREKFPAYVQTGDPERSDP
jgi:RNA polymerase sigma factor (sigma-70 family)